MKRLTSKLILLFGIITLAATACSDNDEEQDNEKRADKGSVPTNLIGQKITLIDKNNHPYDYGLWIRPVNETYCEAENMTKTDSKYLYSNLKDNIATLIINGYQVLTNITYVYMWEITLNFTTPTKGTFRGTYLKSNTNFVASISGDFYIGEANPNNNNESENNGSNNNGDTNTGNNNQENKEMQAVVSSVEEFNGKHNIYVHGEYADKSISKYLTVGFCAGTTQYPKITDIATSEQIENPNNNSARTISELSGGTTYYIRPFHVNSNNITYYRSTSVETLGKNIKLSATIQDNHQYGKITYDIKTKGTYELGVSFWSISGIKKESLGYVSNASGSKSFNVGSTIWSKYESCTVSLKDINTGILYCYKIKIG